MYNIKVVISSREVNYKVKSYSMKNSELILQLAEGGMEIIPMATITSIEVREEK